MTTGVTCKVNVIEQTGFGLVARHRNWVRSTKVAGCRFGSHHLWES